MSVLKRRPAQAGALARWALIAVALTPAGWVSGIVLAFLSGEGGAESTGPVTAGLLGVLLFVAAPATAVVLRLPACPAPAADERAKGLALSPELGLKAS